MSTVYIKIVDIATIFHCPRFHAAFYLFSLYNSFRNMASAQQQAALKGANCEIAFDNLTCQLYATDASHYQIEPMAVAFPRTVRQVSALVDGAVQANVSITARGAGTGLVGGALGDGLIIDFSRWSRQISDLDLDRRTVRVGSGVVLDQLNMFLRPHGYCFGPDVATSSRATLGGMIANNSSGSHTPYYGTTADHLCELEVVLADGRIAMVGPSHDTLRRQRELLADLLMFHSLEIAEHLPPGLLKRRPGYGIDRCAQHPDDLNFLLCGSEGTLGLITSAELKIVPLPEKTGLVLIFFDALEEAMQAVVELLDTRPAAIEHLDYVLLDQTRGQREFKSARDLLRLDEMPTHSVLVVEFFDDVEDSMRAVSRKRLGKRMLALRNEHEIVQVWALRKAGLSLLTGRKGPAKPVTVIEDAAVRPKDLPSYVGEVRKLLKRLDLEASFYGHAAAGLLHVRPILDLRSSGDRTKFRVLAQEVSKLVRQFKGSLAGEHGVGIARTEFMEEQLGERLLGVMRELKNSFDPNHLFNPGKIVPDGRFNIDADLRWEAGHPELPFKPVLAFAERDDFFYANLDQCNGCGGCRKETPSMCPTFVVTRQEVLSTRGRANLIRAALEGRGESNLEPLLAPEMEVALESCLSCKACTVECPSNVNLALLKTELLNARIEAHGLSLRQRLFSSVDALGRVGCLAPQLANFFSSTALTRKLLQKFAGISATRPLPPFARKRFDHWFARQPPAATARRGRVVLWDDTFTRYYEPHIGIAAVKVLQRAGFQVALVKGRACCGRPAFSQGHIAAAAASGAQNLALLGGDVDNAPILFLEPSCYSMFVQDYREMKLSGAERIAARCFLFEQFLEALLEKEPEALSFKPRAGNVVIHAHCHVKALTDASFLRKLVARLPERNAALLNSACCGMAGSFGMLEEKQELSAAVAEPLVQSIRAQPFGTMVLASGASCRHQLDHLVPIRARHTAELLAEALA